MATVVPKNPPAENIPSQAKDVKRLDEKLAEAGKYEVTKDETFKISFALRGKENRWIVVDEFQATDKDEKHWIEFRMWNFDEDVELKKASTQYDHLKRIHFVDNDVLNRMKVQKLLKAWSFEKENPRLKLLHVNGILSDESYNAFKMLHPNIIHYVLEKMNDILEYNE